MHNFGKIRLFTPISHRLLFWASVVFGPWTVLLYLAGVGWSSGGMTLHVLLPGAVTWWVVYVVDGGARPDELVGSWVRYGAACRPAPHPVRHTSTVRVVR